MVLITTHGLHAQSIFKHGIGVLGGAKVRWYICRTSGHMAKYSTYYSGTDLTGSCLSLLSTLFIPLCSLLSSGEFSEGEALFEWGINTLYINLPLGFHQGETETSDMTVKNLLSWVWSFMTNLSLFGHYKTLDVFIHTPSTQLWSSKKHIGPTSCERFACKRPSLNSQTPLAELRYTILDEHKHIRHSKFMSN